MHVVNSSPGCTGQPHLQTQPAPCKWTQMCPNGHTAPSTWAPLDQASPRGLHWFSFTWMGKVCLRVSPALFVLVALSARLIFHTALVSLPLQSFLAAGIIQTLFLAPRTCTIQARTELIHWDIYRAHSIRFQHFYDLWTYRKHFETGFLQHRPSLFPTPVLPKLMSTLAFGELR